MERVKGIEPSQSAWKADVLPLNYTRKSKQKADNYGKYNLNFSALLLERVTRFELATFTLAR
jgi:hypothetical protein